MSDIEKPTVINLENVSDEDLEKVEKISNTNLQHPIEDEAAKFNDSNVEYSEKEWQKLSKKVNIIILPIIMVSYIFFYVDKTTLSYAALQGVKKDLHMKTGNRYSLASSMFYVGYFFFSVICNYFLIKYPINWVLGTNIFIWGVLLMCQSACKTYGEFLLLRFVGGAFESVADPAFILITSQFFERHRQPKIMGIWYTANGFGISVGGLLGYGIGQIKGSLTTTAGSWKYEFIIVGTVCCFWGIMILLILPVDPVKSKYFNDREKKILVHVLRNNQTGISVNTRVFKWYQFKEALLDIKLWLLFFICLFHNYSNGIISNFGALIIGGLGYSGIIASVLQVPYGIIIALFILSCVYLNEYFISKLKKNLRVIFTIIFLIPNIVGAFGLLFIDQKHDVGKLMCYYLTGAYNASFIMILSLSASNIAGHTKKVTFNAIYFMGYCCGNTVGPFLAKSNQAARGYPLASGGMILSLFVEAGLLLMFSLVCYRSNNEKDKAQGITDPSQRVIRYSFEDLTDKENPDFRYVY